MEKNLFKIDEINQLLKTLESEITIGKFVEILNGRVDVFAMSFLVWYVAADDAEIYKQQKLSTYEMLQLYKSRPYLKTDNPQEN